MPENHIAFSVVVCFYNGANRLASCFDHLAQQKCEVDFEVLLVDNASTDSSREVAEALIRNHPHLQARYLFEPKKGKQNAFIKGVKNAKGQLIVICDDDNWLNDDYLQRAWEIMQAHPEVGIIGGRSEGVFEIDPPHWFHKICFRYAVGPQALGESGIYKVEIPWGAGMVLRKNWLIALIESNYPLLVAGPTSDQDLSGAEDTELVFLARLMGWKVYISQEMVFRHAISAQRLTKEHARRLSLSRPATYRVVSQFYQALQKWQSATFRTKWSLFIAAAVFPMAFPGDSKQILQLFLGPRFNICNQTREVQRKIFSLE